MYVCVCNAISDRQVKQAISQGKQSVRDLRVHFGFESCCGKCTTCMRNAIKECQLTTSARACPMSEPVLAGN